MMLRPRPVDIFFLALAAARGDCSASRGDGARAAPACGECCLGSSDAAGTPERLQSLSGCSDYRAATQRPPFTQPVAPRSNWQALKAGLLLASAL